MEQSMYGVSVSTLRHYDVRFDHIPPPMVEDLRLTFAHAVRS
jgi:hypothetical protein